MPHPPGAFPLFSWFTARLVSSRVGGSQLTRGSASRTASTSPGNSRRGGPHDTTPQSSQPRVPEFLRVVGIVRIAETFRKLPFILLGNALVPEAADIQPKSLGWRHLTRLEPYFQDSHEKSVVGPGKLGAPKDPAVMDKSPATAYKYMVDLLPCTTGIGIPSPAVQVRSLEPRSSYPQFPFFSRKVKEH